MRHNTAGFALEIDGIDYAKELVPRLMSLSFTEKLGEEADKLEITLSNHDGLLPTIKRGVDARLALGWVAGPEVRLGMVDKGRFLVDQVEKSGPPDTLRISARSADLTGGFRRRRDRSWKQTNLGSVLGQIASDNGYTARVQSDLANLPVALIEQAAKSDAAFLRDLGERYDAIATVKDRVLLFLRVGASENAGGQAFGSLVLRRQENSRWTFRIADREEHDGAEAQWQDRDEARRKTVKEGKAENPKRIKRSFASEAEARTAAQAEARRAARGKYEFDYEMALGDPAIEPNVPVTLQGWDPEIDGIRWLVDEVEHRLDAGGGLGSRVKLVSLGG